MAWNKDVPAAGIQARYLDDAVRENNTAIDAVFGDLLDAGAAVTASAAEVNSTCDGNTATAAEITAVCDGNTATAAEITAVCDGNTATAAELSQLHSQGAVAADFAKLHAVTRDATDINNLVTLAGTENMSGKTFTDVITANDGVAFVGNTEFLADSSVNAGRHYLRISPTDLLGAVAIIYDYSDSTLPGQILLSGYNGSSHPGLYVLGDGTINLPVGLEIGGVAVPYLYTTVSAGGDFTGTVYLTKIGRTVTMSWASLTHSSSSLASSGAGVIPAAYRPIVDARKVYHASTSGYISVFFADTGGSFTIGYIDYAGGATARTFTQSGNTSWVSAS